MLNTNRKKLSKKTKKGLELAFELLPKYAVEMMLRTGYTRKELIILLSEHYSLREISNKTGLAVEILKENLNS